MWHDQACRAIDYHLLWLIFGQCRNLHTERDYSQPQAAAD
jgi:hypothetical protein